MRHSARWFHDNMTLSKYLIVAIDFNPEKIPFQCFDLDFLRNEIGKDSHYLML